MPASPTKLQRWLDLIAFLVGRRVPVTVEELMERIPAYAQKWGGDETAQATARRTFERDKDELRRAGIPIRTVRYTINWGREEIEGYRLDRKDFYLPYVRLLEEYGPSDSPGTRPSFDLAPGELDLAVRALGRVADLPSFPFASDARSALRKLTFDLHDHLGDEPAPVLFLERPGDGDLRGMLRELSDALLQRKRVRFRYHGLYRDEETLRDVAPYALLFQQGHWYLVGDDATRDAVRVFRVSRMRDVERNTSKPHSPDYDVPDTFDVEQHVGRRAWEFHGEGEEAVRAEVAFRFPQSLQAERHGHGTLVEARDDGSAVRAFEVRQVAPFLRWLLSFEDEAVVLEPREMREAMQEMARMVAVRHGHDAGDDARGDHG